MIGVREALSWLKDKHLDNVDIEMDAQLVCQGIHGGGGWGVFRNLVNDVKEMAAAFACVRFSFVKRSANMAAHMLARDVVFNSDCREWIVNPRDFLVHVLSIDCD